MSSAFRPYRELGWQTRKMKWVDKQFILLDYIILARLSAKGEPWMFFLKNEGLFLPNSYFKAIGHFRYKQKLKVHRFKNNLQGLQKVMVKRPLLIYYSMKCFTFWENIKTISILDSENYGFILNTCHDTRNKEKQGWVFPLFSPDSDDRLSPNFHRFVIWYRSCDTRSMGLGQYCFILILILIGRMQR